MACSPERCEKPGPRGGPCSACRKRRERSLRGDEINARQRERYRENPEPTRAAVRRWRTDHLEQERTRERAKSARYRAEHLDEMKAAILRANARWKAEHPVAWSLRNREQVRRRKIGPVDPVDYAAVLERDGMTCHICGDPITSFADLEFDHVIPTILGGEHTDSNVRPSHLACNRRKGGRPIPD